MAAYKENALDVSSFELADAGMACLTEKFGVVGAEAFISLILREKLDYTKWRRDYYDSMKPGEFHEKAVEYAKEHPYRKSNKTLISKCTRLYNGCIFTIVLIALIGIPCSCRHSYNFTLC